MQLIAVLDCPQGQRTGQIFEATEDAASVLILVGCAKPYGDEADPPTPASLSLPRRLRYRTRALTAE